MILVQHFSTYLYDKYQMCFRFLRNQMYLFLYRHPILMCDKIILQILHFKLESFLIG